MDIDRIRVGVIGAAGGIGGGRVQSFTGNPHVVITRAADSRPEALADLEKEGVKLSTWQETVEADDVDAVSVSVPNTLHEEIVAAALDAGKHAVCEYPMAQTLEGYDALVAKAESKGVVLNHALTVREEDLHLTRHKNIPRLGNIVCARIRYYGGRKFYLIPELRGEPFLSFQIHFIDQFEHHFGKCQCLIAHEPLGRDRSGEPYFGSLLMVFENDVPFYQEFAMGFDRNPSYTGSVVGERGYFDFDRSGVCGEDADGKFDEKLPSGGGGTIKLNTDAFIREIRGEAPPVRTLAEGRRATELSILAARSAMEGGVLIDVSDV